MDDVLYDAKLIVTGCLRPTPIDNLEILSSIQSASLLRLEATLSVAKSAALRPIIRMLNC